MLLNRVLTVAPGQPASHRGWGWEKVTELPFNDKDYSTGNPSITYSLGLRAR